MCDYLLQQYLLGPGSLCLFTNNFFAYLNFGVHIFELVLNFFLNLRLC